MKQKTKSITLAIYFLLMIFIMLSSVYIINFFLVKKEAKHQSNLLNETAEKDLQNIQGKIQEEETQMVNESKEKIIQKEEQKQDTERMITVRNLKEQNKDIVGWLEIENTTINYPVLQGSDNTFYMTHNYKKQKSKNGSIFLNSNYDWTISSNNLLVYGHNLGNGMMFQELLKYEKEDFYKKHPTVRFTTVDEDNIYEIIAVFKSRVYYKSEKDVFRYYYFINNESEEEYNMFIKNAKKASLYSINATAVYGDSLITLSTCSYHVKDGRFAIVARKCANVN